MEPRQPNAAAWGRPCRHLHAILSQRSHSPLSTRRQRGILAVRRPCPWAWHAATAVWRPRRSRGRMTSVRPYRAKEVWTGPNTPCVLRDVAIRRGLWPVPHAARPSHRMVELTGAPESMSSAKTTPTVFEMWRRSTVVQQCAGEWQFTLNCPYCFSRSNVHAATHLVRNLQCCERTSVSYIVFSSLATLGRTGAASRCACAPSAAT